MNEISPELCRPGRVVNDIGGVGSMEAYKSLVAEAEADHGACWAWLARRKILRRLLRSVANGESITQDI